MQAQDVAFGVLEPGRLFRAEHADMLDRLEPRQVVVGKAHAGCPQRRDSRFDVFDPATGARLVDVANLGPAEAQAAIAADVASMRNSGKQEPHCVPQSNCRCTVVSLTTASPSATCSASAIAVSPTP